ncbi:WD-40 repeat protein [Halomicronema hongdechloris C2206]|uniref:WD-40 repeat protein n=1 Tax=Halomicronema hongdechloris C2206 TaxID=1641165 RepID=A0A1Z3HIC8_9CYAN|nr:WD40 repeat domain-containing protein [Halomicronema hongdechloris]ASC70040.1 WD-40 repeat protein [Halomicronema hongdechloris C2206]
MPQGLLYVRSVRFSPTGNYLVSGSADYSIRLWNLENQTSTTIDDDDLNGWIESVDFRPDGQQFAAGSSGGIAKIWDLDGNVVQTLPGHVGTVNRARFSPDGHTLAAVAGDGQVRVWSLMNKAIAQLDTHTDALWNVDVSSDGTQIATASVDGTTRIWDRSGAEIRRLELPTNQVFNDVVYSPGGNTIATSTIDGDIQLWDAEGNLVNRFAMHGQRVLGLDLSPDGKYGLSGSDDTTAKLWDLEGNVQAVVNHDEWIRDVAFSPDGQTFATTSEDTLARLWDLDGNLLAEFEGHADGVNGISFSPDGTMLVTASDDSTVKLWDVQGNLIHSFQKHHGRVWTVAFSPDGDSIATGTSEGYARLWDLDGNLIGEFKGHEEVVTGVAFSPDGQYLISASGDSTAKVWRIARTLDDLLAQGCDWLADYLTLHPDALMELENCQRPDLLPKAASYLVKTAMQTARTGNVQLAQQQLATALTWNPDVDLDPETPEHEQNATQMARKFSAAYSLTEGQRLAHQLKLEDATQAYERALELDAEVDLDPQTDAVEQDADLIARRYVALSLQQRGQLQAQQLKLKAAVQTLEEALDLDPTIDLNPDTEEIDQDAKAVANRFSAPGHLAAGQQQVKNGDVEAAAQAYQTAQDLDPDLEVDRRVWDTLCWFGSVQGQATTVRFACENKAYFGGVSTLDSRGIVLALDGDLEGSIESFQAYIDVPGRSQDRVIQGQAWINALKTGDNPFLTDD